MAVLSGATANSVPELSVCIFIKILTLDLLTVNRGENSDLGAAPSQASPRGAITCTLAAELARALALWLAGANRGGG
jgi:hypothetical protein